MLKLFYKILQILIIVLGLSSCGPIQHSPGDKWIFDTTYSKSYSYSYVGMYGGVKFYKNDYLTKDTIEYGVLVNNSNLVVKSLNKEETEKIKNEIQQVQKKTEADRQAAQRKAEVDREAVQKKTEADRQAALAKQQKDAAEKAVKQKEQEKIHKKLNEM